jgi:hypothetical protein
MAIVVSDNMTGSNWADITDRVGQVGAVWNRHPDTPGSRWYIFLNRVHCGVAGAFYASGIPDSADYDVECDYIIYTDIPNVGIAGRMNTSTLTFYYTYYQGGELVLAKMVGGAITSLGWWVTTLTGGGTTYNLKLSMVGDQIKVYVNDVERIAVTDSSITATGRAGIRSVGINDAYTGKHIDNFVVTDASSTIVQQASTPIVFGL